MALASPFSEAKSYACRETIVYGPATLPAYFRAPQDEYATACSGAVVFDRSDRGLLVARGSDRKAWLHNLVTNAVRNLDDYAGNYAFATSVKGRVLFDVNILSLPDALWLDIDVNAVSAAAAHFDRHLFTEDVRMENAGGSTARLACSGPRAAELARALGVVHFPALPALASVRLADGGAHLVRHDAAGAPGFELSVPRGEAAGWWERLVATGAQPAGHHTLDVLRIEAGIPWLGRDIDETVLPPETGQGERGINYHKGCYLGQEVLERMRAREALARRLVRVQISDGQGCAVPAPIERDGRPVGRITSLARHPARKVWIGLGYLQTTVTGFAELVAGDPPRPVTIVSAE